MRNRELDLNKKTYFLTFGNNSFDKIASLKAFMKWLEEFT